jgi:hypothetical protein
VAIAYTKGIFNGCFYLSGERNRGFSSVGLGQKLLPPRVIVKKAGIYENHPCSGGGGSEKMKDDSRVVSKSLFSNPKPFVLPQPHYSSHLSRAQSKTDDKILASSINILVNLCICMYVCC